MLKSRGVLELGLFTVLSSALYFGRSSAVLQNVTYDNLDPSVTYLPQGGDGWDIDIKEGLDYKGSHAVASGDPDASAVFQFTGVAVYYFSPLWPYNVSTVVSLDGGNNMTLNLMDMSATPASVGSAATASSAARYGYTGLSNSSHSLKMYMVQGINYSDPNIHGYIVVDGFNVTIDDGVQDPSSNGHRINVSAIAGGVTGGIVGLAISAALFFRYYRPVKSQEEKPWGEQGVLEENSASVYARPGDAPYNDFGPLPFGGGTTLDFSAVALAHQSTYSQITVPTTSPGAAWAPSTDSGTPSKAGAGGSTSTPSGSIAERPLSYFNEKRLQLLAVNNEEPPAPPPYAPSSNDTDRE
ncbi:hypothetical protein J3R30DRAFT_704187 [Lentinula aciculospora]|uniref:Uncharacterized protein n=1 Tax=Lentinula aciculospora TaxID=153920 RepID=A0A9W9A627_9AGAR|nr:hypothetical protein J3R30DRAFT_704187 [Lentinula aciculospora]